MTDPRLWEPGQSAGGTSSQECDPRPGSIGRGSATPRAQWGASDMGGQGSWSASHMEVSTELEHRRLATKAESHPSSRQEGGGQTRAMEGGVGPKSSKKVRRQVLE